MLLFFSSSKTKYVSKPFCRRCVEAFAALGEFEMCVCLFVCLVVGLSRSDGKSLASLFFYRTTLSRGDPFSFGLGVRG